MNGDKQKFSLRNITGTTREAPSSGTSMRIRLYAFLIVLVAIMVSVTVFILITTGRIMTGRREAEKYAVKEFSCIHQSLVEQYGEIPNQLISMSELLSESVERYLSHNGIQIGSLRKHPEVLEGLIGGEFSRIQSSLERTSCSGAFMVLDATVNPSPEKAENYKAGLYIRHSEPDVSAPPYRAWSFYVGFQQIAQQNSLLLQPLWSMEFDVAGCDFFDLPMKSSRETLLPLSNLYHWSMENIIPGLEEAVLVCSIPLVGSDGKPFGVCGFEMSASNFSSRFAPDNSEYSGALVTFGKLDGNKLDMENALTAGVTATIAGITGKVPLSFSSRRGLDNYRQVNGRSYSGLHEEIKMYPADSPFDNQHYAVSLLIPKDTIDKTVRHEYMFLAFICVVLLLSGALVSAVIVDSFMKPFTSAFDSIRNDDISSLQKTNIKEIDALVEKIKETRVKASPSHGELFGDFIARIKTLTPTEMKIFRYHAEGKSINEIKATMFISVSTVKTHNNHIYAKLGISSKNELMLYAELLKKSGWKLEGTI